TPSAEPVPGMPLPRGNQLLPSHRAMLLAVTPPALVKLPPAYTSPATLTATAFTAVPVPSLVPFTPLPSGYQLVPSQHAMRLALVRPMPVNKPPAYTLPLPVDSARNPGNTQPSLDPARPRALKRV